MQNKKILRTLICQGLKASLIVGMLLKPTESTAVYVLIGEEEASTPKSTIHVKTQLSDKNQRTFNSASSFHARDNFACGEIEAWTQMPWSDGGVALRIDPPVETLDYLQRSILSDLSRGIVRLFAQWSPSRGESKYWIIPAEQSMDWFNRILENKASLDLRGPAFTFNQINNQ